MSCCSVGPRFGVLTARIRSNDAGFWAGVTSDGVPRAWAHHKQCKGCSTDMDPSCVPCSRRTCVSVRCMRHRLVSSYFQPLSAQDWAGWRGRRNKASCDPQSVVTVICFILPAPGVLCPCGPLMLMLSNVMKSLLLRCNDADAHTHQTRFCCSLCVTDTQVHSSAMTVTSWDFGVRSPKQRAKPLDTSDNHADIHSGTLTFTQAQPHTCTHVHMTQMCTT